MWHPSATTSRNGLMPRMRQHRAGKGKMPCAVVVQQIGPIDNSVDQTWKFGFSEALPLEYLSFAEKDFVMLFPTYIILML
mmetsp:Transcript_45292/g.114993  ORF Transcript_45292/g.114993 Transcript_45292/m.114993 type:complete len:80 (+) Transcript_45292:202-441(+)